MLRLSAPVLACLLAACGGGTINHQSRGDAGLDSAPPGVDAAPPGESSIIWPMFQRDPQHSGRAAGHLGPSPSVKWTVAGDPNNWGMDVAGVAGDGTVYVVQSAANATDPPPALFAFGPDGTTKWRVTLGTSPGGANSEVVSPDNGITLSTAGGCIHFDATGRMQWHLAGCDFVTAMPNGTLLVDSPSRGVGAADPRNGTILWWSGAPALENGTLPAVAPDGTVYVADGGAITAIRENGSMGWQVPLGSAPSSITTGPVVSGDGTIYAGTIDGSLYAVSPTGSQRWMGTARLAGDTSSNPVYYGALAVGADGTVYFESQEENPTSDAELVAFSPEGMTRWSTRLMRSGWPSMIVGSDGALVLPTYDGTLLLISGSTGLLAGTVAVGASGGAQPLGNAAMTPDGTLYVAAVNDGRVYAVAGH